MAYCYLCWFLFLLLLCDLNVADAQTIADKDVNSHENESIRQTNDPLWGESAEGNLDLCWLWAILQ